MDLCDAYQKWRHVYWRMRRGGLLAFLVVSVVMVTACQGNGELGEPDRLGRAPANCPDRLARPPANCPDRLARLPKNRRETQEQPWIG